MGDIGYAVKPISLKTYKKNKIKMLEKEFLISLTPEQRTHINGLENEYAVDRYSRDILRKSLFAEVM